MLNKRNIFFLFIILLYSENTNGIDDITIPKYWFVGKAGYDVQASGMPKDVAAYKWFSITVDIPFDIKTSRTEATFTIKNIPQPTSFIYPDNSLYVGEKGWNFMQPTSNDGFIIGAKNGFIKTGDLKGFFFQMKLKERKIFKLANKSYTLTLKGERDFKKEKEILDYYEGLEMAVKNFTLTLESKNKAGKIIEQKVFVDINSIVHLGMVSHNIWVTDINGDNLPDIICPIENSINAYDMALFISSTDKKGNIIYTKSHYKPCSC